VKRKDLIRHLITHGCVLAREGSNHSIWENLLNGRRSAVPRHREILDITAKAICRQLEIADP